MTNLPQTVEQWVTLAKAQGLGAQGILAEGDPFQSGSNFSILDFLRLRILHRPSVPEGRLEEEHQDFFPRELRLLVRNKFKNHPQT